MNKTWDFAVIGTGLAPLVCAKHLLSKGHSVGVINPEWDFFQENSELSFDPSLNSKKLANAQPANAIDILRPEYPGSIETWEDGNTNKSGFRDISAPYVRTRSRMWMRETAKPLPRILEREWETVEQISVELLDEGINPQELEDVLAASKFPGYSGKGRPRMRGWLIPRVYDCDVGRFRLGLLEFLRERLGPEKLVTDAGTLDFRTDGIHYQKQGGGTAIPVSQRIIIFWTPALDFMVRRLSNGQPIQSPTSFELWEEWTVLSRESLHPGTIGTAEGMTAWTHCLGSPEDQTSGMHDLRVLRKNASHFYKPDSRILEPSWVSGESLEALQRLLVGILEWKDFTIRAMSPRVMFNWDTQTPDCQVIKVGNTNVLCEIVSRCDGPIVDVVLSGKRVAEKFA